VKRWALFFMLVTVGSARAQPAGTAAPIGAGAGSALGAAAPAPTTPEPVLAPVKADDATCLTLDTTPGTLLQASPQVPTPFSEFAVEGALIDSPSTVHALLAPTLAQYGSTVPAASWAELSKMAAKYGYQLVGHRTEGAKLVLHLASLPMVLKVNVDIDQGLFDKLLDDEVSRRMRLRAGAFLPWEPIRRKCALLEEQRRVEEYLHEEGYFDASVKIEDTKRKGAVELSVEVELGKEYTIGRIDIPRQPSGEPLAISDAEIKKVFVHTCTLCSERFTRSQHQEDIQAVKEMFHKRGFPGVRVQSNFDPRTSFDRRTKHVNITLAIDQRRQLDVQFEGFNYEGFSLWDLQHQLTFDQAGSADDVEAAESAHAITTFLQQRGFFDARVTWTRERFETRATALDRVVYRIDLGGTREVTAIEFRGNRAIDVPTLSDVIVTKTAQLDLRGALFGGPSSASSEQLATDVERIKEAYRRLGYRDARVRVSISPDFAALDSAAATAPLVASGRGGTLAVRFTVEEGEPTRLVQIEIDRGDEGKQLDPALCEQLLRELAAEIGDSQLAKRDGSKDALDHRSCIGTAASLNFREDDVAATRDRLRDWLFKIGRPRAIVEYSASESAPHRIKAHFTVSKIEALAIGKIVLRGAFQTQAWVIYDELGFHEGDKLTTEALAEGARRLRNTGLFDAVNIDLPELENRDNNSLVVNAIVRVEERYIDRAQVELETGLSSFNGFFGTARWTQRNLFGLGLSLTLTGTYGTRITDIESTLAIPPWIVRRLHSPIDFRTELTALYRQQDTARFGQVTTEGATVSFSCLCRPWQRQRTATHSARAINIGLHYDFRLRSRYIDALRPIGVDLDQSQVAISTRSGSIGATFEWEQRVDRNGSLAPLAAEDGFHLEGSVAFYSPILYGQDTFLKISAAVSKFVPVGSNLVIRGDLRYDEGFPLKGAALLPEVERYFAGGDSTVRGYNDDRMSTEIIRVAVPPLDNVTQIRVIPSGGNIRMLASLDAQLRIWSIFAAALFTDAGMITNQWSSVTAENIRPSVGTGVRFLSPFGIGAIEYAVPLRLQLGDDPRGRWHVYFAARAQF
jgi:outer membrane protein assembly factor BamA